MKKILTKKCKLVLIYVLTGILCFSSFWGGGNLAVKADNEERAASQWTAEASQALSDIAQKREIMAVINLCREYTLRENPDLQANAVTTVPCGQTVTVRDVRMNADGSVWILVNALMGKGVFDGWVEDEFLACADERYLSWKENFGIINTAPMAHAVGDEDDDEIPADIKQFPESYHEGLLALKEKHAEWTFVPMFTGLEWNTVITEELKYGRSLVHRSLPDYVKEGAYDQGNWFYASREILERYMDPRSCLNEDTVFQFEQLTYNESYHTLESMEQFLAGTFMNSSQNAPGTAMTYATIIWAIGKEEGREVSPFHLAARILQEQGQGKSALISGTYPGFEGYYNYFNVGATGTTNQQVIESGLRYAKNANPPWTNAYYSILGGADVISANYIKRGQDTLYLQKFNVNPQSLSSLYTHQYMQNISAPYTESKSIFKLYQSAQAQESPFVFKIPVYEKMPEEPCSVPARSLNIVLEQPSGFTGSEVFVDGMAKEAERRNGRVIVKAADDKASHVVINFKDTAGNVTKQYHWEVTYDNSHYTAKSCGEPTAPDNIVLELPEGFSGKDVWLDGILYQGTLSGNQLTVTPMDQNVKTAVMYVYDSGRVPIDMYVWTLEFMDGKYRAKLQPQLQGLIDYNGFSIRIVGNPGIRFKSAIREETKEALTGDGVDGYHLKEYGNLLVYSSYRQSYPFVKSCKYVSAAMAYGTKEDGSLVDFTYEKSGDKLVYTCVLVNQPVSEYKTNFAFRGYVVLEKDGEEIVIHGPMIVVNYCYLAEIALSQGNVEPGSDGEKFLKKILEDAEEYEKNQVYK